MVNGTRKFVCVAINANTNKGEGSKLINASSKDEAMAIFKRMYPNMEIRALTEVSR